jgi:Mpv17 / PMP22 family
MSKALLAAILCVSCSTALAFMPKPLLRAQPVAAASTTSRAPTTKMSFDLATTYITALHNHYYPTTCLQALGLVSLGDVMAQCLETSSGDGNGAPISLDWRRTLRMGTLGVIIGGLGTATWLRYLEDQLPVIESHAAASFVDLPLWLYEPVLRAFELSGPEHSVGLDTVADSLLVVVKATLDVCVWAPIANTLYLALTPLSEGRGLASAAESISDNFIPVMKSELKTFFPYNLVAFALIPPLVRPFTTGVLSMAFSTYISWVTHLEPKLAIALATADAQAQGERRTERRTEMARDAMLVVAAMDAIDAMRTDAARVVAAMEHTDAARRVVEAMERIDAAAGRMDAIETR